MIKKIIALTSLFGLLTYGVYAGISDTIYTDEQYGFSISLPSGFQTVKNHKGARIVIVFPQKLSRGFYRDNIAVSISSIQRANKTADEIMDIYFKYDGTVLGRKEMFINGTRFFSIEQTHTRSFWFFKLRIKLLHLIAEKGTMLYTVSYSATTDNYDRNINKAKQVMHTFKFTE
jgi:hypothetical protein